VKYWYAFKVITVEFLETLVVPLLKFAIIQMHVYLETMWTRYVWKYI